MNCVNGSRDPFITQCKQPADPVSHAVSEIEPQRLDQHQMSEVLHHEPGTRLRSEQLLPHTIEGPSQTCLIILVTEPNDGWH